ncbi:MAG TPA: hypothetical protein VGL53_13970 [Bryobacteraceae bacterium]|jgi:hypothetical protein
MDPVLRRRFNETWTPEKYARFLERIDSGSGTHVSFRNCETPCFFPRALIEKMAGYGRELVLQLTGSAEYRKRSDATIPAEFHVAHEDPLPMFLQADFGIAENLEPKLVEIQAFPSLYAYQPFLAQTYRDVYELDVALDPFLDGLNSGSYEELLRTSIVGEHRPENVVLLEIDPAHQKTLCDFLLTERLLGVRAVCVTRVHQSGRELWYENDEGKRVAIHRIYNRAIVDELERKQIKPGFDLTGDLDVEWAGHPNWYFRISKFSIPYLKHVSVPKTWFLNELPEIPPDLENYVLKPLYSFAGLGVVVGPTKADIDAVPDAQRADYILQERVNFIPVIETPHGPTKAEVRVMYIWPAAAPEPIATTTIIRMGRGKMMGVDHNKNMEWVGASAGFLV